MNRSMEFAMPTIRHARQTKNPATVFKFRCKALSRCIALCSGIAFAALAPLTALADSPVAVTAITIPAGDLAEALNRFARAAGVTLSFTPEQVNGLKTAGVAGASSMQEGLEQLLRGTGLRAAPNANGYVLVRQEAEATLAPVRVQSNVERDAVTEGSGTYAANATTIFKGAKSLREIPQSVSVLTREQMDDQGITRLEQAYTQMPGVRLDGYADTSRLIVRGFQASTQLDGIPVAQEGFYQLDPAIYDRVEMLRGPSGLYAGSGEPGGTVNLVRKRPGDQFGLAGSISYGSWNDARTEIDVTGPLNEIGSLRGRAVAVYQDRDMFYDVADERRNLVYGILEYDLTPRDTFSLSATQMENVGNAFWGLPRYSDGSLPGLKSFVGATDVDTTKEVAEVMVDYRHRFDNDWQAKATYSNRDVDYTSGGMYAYSAIDVATGIASGTGSYSEDKDEYQAFDMNLSGPFTLCGRTHQAAMGYNRAVKNYVNHGASYPYFAAADVLSLHDLGISKNEFILSGYATYTKQSGAYASLNLRILEPLSLIFGGRITDYSHRSRNSYSDPWINGDAKANDEFTPYAGLVYDFTEQLSLYGSYAEIFVPQSNKDYTGSVLEPRTGEQYEIGIKGAFLKEKLNASLATYQLRDENRAMDDLDPTHICSWNGSGLCSKAAGKIQSRGVEAEVSGTPAPRLNISAGYTFNRSKYLSDADPANVGKTPDSYRNPKHLLKLWAQYSFAESYSPAKLSNWTVGGGVIAQSHLEIDEAYLSRPYRQGSYAIVSAKLGYRVNKNINIIFDVDNLFDKNYLEDLGNDTYYNIYGEPRSYRMTLHYKLD